VEDLEQFVCSAMFFNRLVAPVARQTRNFRTSAVRFDDPGGIPGANLPVNIYNEKALIIKMTLYFGSAFATPYLILRHQLKKRFRA